MILPLIAIQAAANAADKPGGTDWVAVTAVITGAGVLITLVALMVQIKSLDRTMQSSTYQEIVRMFDDFSKLLMENPGLGEILFENAVPKNATQRSKVKWALAIRFDWFESIVIQRHRYKAIPPAIYHHWMNVLKFELTCAVIKQYWAENGTFYHPDLQRVVSHILNPPTSPQ